MKHITNKSVKIIVTKNNKLIHSEFNSFGSINEIKAHISCVCRKNGIVNASISYDDVYKNFRINTNK